MVFLFDLSIVSRSFVFWAASVFPFAVNDFDFSIFTELGLFDGTLFRVSVWWENGSLYEVHDVEGTEIQLKVLDDAVRGARVSLQVTPITAIVVLFYLDVDIDIIPNLILIFSI